MLRAATVYINGRHQLHIKRGQIQTHHVETFSPFHTALYSPLQVRNSQILRATIQTPPLTLSKRPCSKKNIACTCTRTDYAKSAIKPTRVGILNIVATQLHSKFKPVLSRDLQPIRSCSVSSVVRGTIY